MNRANPQIVWLVSFLRWLLPLAIAFLSVGYVLFTHVLVEHSLLSPDPMREILVVGLAGPAVIWLVLHWVLKIAIAEAEAQRELALRNRELAVLNAIGEVASQSLDLDEVLQVSLENLVKLMGLDAGEIRLVKGNQLILKTNYGLSKSKMEEKVIRFGQCICGQCAQAEKTLSVENLPGVPLLSETPCAREGFQSIVCVPMKNKGQILGVILLASRDSTIALTDQRILTAIGYRIAASIENARVYEEAHRRAVHLETSSIVGQRVSSLLNLNSLLAEVVSMIREKFGYHHTHIFLVDLETQEIVLKEASGPSADLIKTRGLRLKIGQEGITGWVASVGQAVVCNDVSREPRYFKSELVPETKSELAVPLHVGNRIVGVLDVQSNQRDAFDKEDVTVLQILGNQIGIAIENARLFQETKRRFDAMAALHQTSLDMIAQLDMTQLLEALLRRGAELLDAQAGSLFLYNPADQLLHNAANYNTWKDFSGVTLRLGEGVNGQVIQTGKPLIVNDYKNWSGKTRVYADSPQSRVIGVPLKWEDQIIGSFTILSNAECRPFDQNDIWLLVQFADLAAIAIQNAELHTAVKEFSQDLERKVEERTHELSKSKEQVAIKAEQLRALLAQTIHIQEGERARLARDMHDGVIQLISAARFQLQATKVVAGSGLAAAGENLDKVFHVLEAIEKEIRLVIYDLHPPILDAIGLAPALQKYTHNFQELSGITCQMKVVGTPYRLPGAVELAIFRMAEEALQNVVAHAEAEASLVTMNYEPTLFCITVQDNGHGFDYERWAEENGGNHLGLIGMRERTQLLGGELQVQSEIGQGTRVTFQLPVVQEEDVP